MLAWFGELNQENAGRWAPVSAAGRWMHVRRADVQLCDPDGDRFVGSVAWRGRPDRHRDIADLVFGWVVLRHLGRPVWPGADAADHDSEA
jgi:hypothetical protein